MDVVILVYNEFFLQGEEAIETSDQAEAENKEQENTSENVEESAQKDIEDSTEKETENETETPTANEGKDYCRVLKIKYLILTKSYDKKTNTFKV